MRDASNRPDRKVSICECCGSGTIIAIEGLFSNPQPGSPRRFCSPACRQAAYRRRRAGVAESTNLQPSGGRNRNLLATEEVTPPAK
jgi:23S rRNA G2445 N2-methylase RlmL